eukprot:XP_013998316.1 PREDICTED: uncharacterized protein LOC106570466 [Salmo salar]
MSKIQLLRGFLNQRLTAAAEEIFEVVEQTIAEYQEECFRTKEENVRLQKLLDIVIKPVIKLHRTDLPAVQLQSQQSSVVFNLPAAPDPATLAVVKRETFEEPLIDTDLPCTPLPLSASSRSTRTRLIKAGSSLNTSPEKLLQTPQLWLTVANCGK